MNRLILGFFITAILLVGGFLVANVLLISSADSGANNLASESQRNSCKSTIQSQTRFMDTGGTLEIPESCFADGEPITEELSGAEVGDEIRVTEEGYELASK